MSAARSSLETDFEYLLQNSPAGDQRLTVALVQVYYGYAHRLARVLFATPQEIEAVLQELFSKASAQLDNFVVGTSFKIWFTRPAIMVCRKRLKGRPPFHIRWIPPTESTPHHPAGTAHPPQAASAAWPPTPAPAIDLSLPLILHTSLGLPLSDLAEIFNTRESKIQERLEQATRTLLSHLEPGWTALPLSPGRTQAHQQARRTPFYGDTLSREDLEQHTTHLQACQSCKAWQEFYGRLAARFQDLAGPEIPPNEEALEKILETAQPPRPLRGIPGMHRLPYMEVFWVLAAVALVLALGRVFNQINPLVELQATVLAPETSDVLTPVSNPPSRVLTISPHATSNEPRNQPDSNWNPVISLDGRSLVFTSSIRHLVEEDTNEVSDIFLYNLDSGAMSRISVDSLGHQANDASYEPSVSADGRYVVFTSWATNLVAGDRLQCDIWGATSGCPDIFLHDRETRETRLISKTIDGRPGDDFSIAAEISADGRWVVFWSAASDIVPDDPETCGSGPEKHNCLDVFLYDREAERLARIPVGRTFRQDARGVFELDISGDGRWITFNLRQDDLLALKLGLTQEHDVFVYDRVSATMEPVNNGAGGVQGNGPSYSASISQDGRWLAFASMADNLVPEDSNERVDVFLKDRETGGVTRISVPEGGGEADGESGITAGWGRGGWFGDGLSIAGDGSRVMFVSSAHNLVIGQQSYSCDYFPGCQNVFLYDRRSRQVEQLNITNVDFIPFTSLSGDGEIGSLMAHTPNCSPDNFCIDIFVFKRESGLVARFSNSGIYTGMEILSLGKKNTLYVHKNWTSSLAFSPSGELMAAGSRAGSVILWSIPEGKAVITLDGEKLAFSPDGSLLATGADDGQVFLWRMPQGFLVGVLNNKQRARGLAFTPDGKILAVGSSKRVRLWNLDQGTLERDIPFPGTIVLDVDISQDGELLAAADDDGTVWIKSLSGTGFELRLGGHTEKVNAVAFSPDGRMLATASNDSQANLWRLTRATDGTWTARLVYSLRHGDWVTSLAFSSNSRWLATGSFDNTVAVWDVLEGALLDVPLRQPQNQVLSVAFGPGDSTLAVGTVRGEVHLWTELSLGD